MQISNESRAPAENARVGGVTLENVTLKKLTCRFHTAAHPQSDCEHVGVIDLDGNELAVYLLRRHWRGPACISLSASTAAHAHSAS